ncbi:MAG: RluA family pseudouridine synthase [Rhodothermales bacterium]
MKLDILYLDNHLLVVNKPAGLLAQGDATGDPTVLTLGKAYLKETFDKPGRVYLGLVHRLDRPASGVMVLARTSKAAQRLTDQFRNRSPEKRYMAIVEGLCQGSGSCEDYLVKERRQVRVVPASYPQAKRAAMTWQTVATRRDGLSLLDIRLETGRSHQIRIQLSHRGWPLLGDIRYGAGRELDGRNLALHAYRLTIEHPTRRESMTWQAVPPPNWRSLFDEAIAQVLTA